MSMNRSLKSAPPRRTPIGGIRMSSTNDVTMRPKAAPRITAAARSATFPRRMKALKSFHMAPILAPCLPRPGPRDLLSAMKAALAAVLLVSLSRAAAAEGVPSPDEFFGFHVGADRTLADWTQMTAYFRALAEASPRVRTEEVGRTTDGRPFLV